MVNGPMDRSIRPHQFQNRNELDNSLAMTSIQQSPSQQNKVVDRQSSFESHVGVCAIHICRKQGPNHPMSHNLRLS
jgi:hypothetical protein